jgi:hypothetical protein
VHIIGLMAPIGLRQIPSPAGGGGFSGGHRGVELIKSLRVEFPTVCREKVFSFARQYPAACGGVVYSWHFSRDWICRYSRAILDWTKTDGGSKWIIPKEEYSNC